MRTITLSSILFLCVFALAGCASVVSKTSWPFSIDTEPQGAAISITNKRGVEIYKGRTPAAMKLKSGSGYFSREQYVITLRKTGYEERKINLECKLNGWYFGNILIGGLVGMLIVDPLTGAMYRLDQDYASVVLRKAGDESASVNTIKVITTDELPDSLKNKMVRLA